VLREYTVEFLWLAIATPLPRAKHSHKAVVSPRLFATCLWFPRTRAFVEHVIKKLTVDLAAAFAAATTAVGIVMLLTGDAKVRSAGSLRYIPFHTFRKRIRTAGTPHLGSAFRRAGPGPNNNQTNAAQD